jgi:hypothetical protein
MHPRLVAALIVVAVLVALGGTIWQLTSRDQARRLQSVERIERSPAQLRMSLTIDYAKGPVAREVYTMTDDNGRSNAQYAVTDRSGTTAQFHETIGGYGVSFLFDRLVSDGVWELTDKPPRGDTSIRYTVSVAQTVQGQSGERTITFTDPQYWATTAGRQFHIHLDPKKPVPDLLTLSSTSTADPRYARVVGDFLQFGSPTFKATIRRARSRLGLP